MEAPMFCQALTSRCLWPMPCCIWLTSGVRVGRYLIQDNVRRISVIRRLWSVRLTRGMMVGMLLVLVLALLAACGGPGGSTTGAGPEQRIKDFTSDFSAALNDPDIGQPAKQEEWANKLAGYFRPADKEKAKADMQEG